MEVILLEDIDKLGKMGDIVKVKEGYARNFLFPKNLALTSTKGNLKKFEEIKRIKFKKIKMNELKAKELAEEMAGMVLTIKRKAGEDGKIFGSVSENDIAELLKSKNIEVEKKQVYLKDKIKVLGTYEAEVKLFGGITTPIKISVEREE